MLSTTTAEDAVHIVDFEYNIQRIKYGHQHREDLVTSKEPVRCKFEINV